MKKTIKAWVVLNSELKVKRNMFHGNDAVFSTKKLAEEHGEGGAIVPCTIIYEALTKTT